MNALMRHMVAGFLGLAALQAGAQSSVTLSGTVDLSVRQVHNQGLGSTTSLASGANSTSKLVLRGQEDLGAGLSAGFYLDGTLLADTGAMGAMGASGPFWDRRSTVSLASRQWGELRLGRDWVPTHLVWSGFDPFATLGIAGANSFRSFTASRALGQAFGTAPESQSANPTLRVSNAVEYFLPSGLGGFQGSLIATAGEKGTTAAGFTRATGFRLGWTGAGWNLAAAQLTTRNTASGTHFKDQSYGVSYDFGWLKASLAQRRWIHGADRTVNTLVGASIPAGPGVVKLSYVKADQTGATAAQSANDADLLGLGYVYSLSRRTALYVHAARISNRGGAAFAVAGGPPVSGSPAAANYFGGRTSTGLEVGLRQDF